MIFRVISIAVVISHLSVSSLKSDESDLSLNDILSKADSVSSMNDSLRAGTKYSYELFSVMNRLNKDGSIKNSDTTIAAITMMGDEEISRELVYSSSGSDGEAKREKRDISFSIDNPDYNFSLTDFDESSYKVQVVPKSSPPKSGQYTGTMELDRRGFYLRRFDFVVPDPEGALKEFAIEMDFEPLEGGLVVPVEMSMRGYVKALLGIIRVRFAGEFRFSNYQILE
jgi:hypothetical protein